MLEAIFSLTTLWWVILLLYIPACIGLIVIVLLQKGKGVGFAGAFGVGGGSDTIFGPRSSKSLPQKITYAAAGTFMVLAGSMTCFSVVAAPLKKQEILIGVFLTVTTPITLMLLVRAALYRDREEGSGDVPQALPRD